MKKQLLTLVFLLPAIMAFPQLNWKKNGNNATPSGFAPTIGTDASWNSPFQLMTNGAIRMHINQDLGGPAANTGFIGLRTTNPQFLLHIDGSTTSDATIFGWKKGLLLSGSSAIMWSGPSTAGLNYFMAYPSSTPSGDFFQGISI